MNCEKAQSLLSEFVDDRLSARLTWELDKHLADCNVCTRVLNETRRTVALLIEAERFDVSDGFAANLQARIAGIEQAPAPAAWMETVRELFRPRVRPIWGAAVGSLALAALLFVQMRPATVTPKAPPAPSTRLVQTARTQTIALVASDPFGDTAAASVAASAAPAAPNGSDPSGDSIY